MKKLLFLVAGAMLAFTASAQSASATQSDASTAVAAQQTIEEGLCPEYYDGYPCAIFVKVYGDRTHGITGFDPVLHVYQFRNPSNMNDRTDITDKVLIDYRVWLTPEDGGTLNYDVTYKYGDGPVQHVVSHFAYL